MNFGKLREVFVQNMPRKKNLLQILHRCHGFREMEKIQSLDPRRLAKALKRRKRPDPLKILAKASLTKHGTWLGTPSQNFKKFGENFVNCEFFVPNDPSSWKLHFAKTQHFQIFHAKLHMLMDGLEIWWSFGPPESQKTSKKWLSATFVRHRKQSWEIWFLTRKMDSKFQNSSWVGKYTHISFQQAYSCPIWTPESAPKVAPKARDPSGQARDLSGSFFQNALYSSEKRSLTQFDFLGWIMILLDVIIVLY